LDESRVLTVLVPKRIRDAIPFGPSGPPCALLCSRWPEKHIYNPDKPGARAEAYVGAY